MDGTAHKVPSNVADYNIVYFARELFLMVINNHVFYMVLSVQPFQDDTHYPNPQKRVGN